jgi:hypothetical protein
MNIQSSDLMLIKHFLIVIIAKKITSRIVSSCWRKFWLTKPFNTKENIKITSYKSWSSHPYIWSNKKRQIIQKIGSGNCVKSQIQKIVAQASQNHCWFVNIAIKTGFKEKLKFIRSLIHPSLVQLFTKREFN